MACTHKLIWKMLPIISVVVWHLTFILVGVLSLSEDQALRGEKCGQSTHIWKYSVLNVVFAFFSLVTYFVFPGGGEGARARAILLTILHFGFAAWGILMWIIMSDTCQAVVQGKYSSIANFHHICIVHNTVLSMVMFLHEAFLGDHIGMDLTVVPEIRKDTAMTHYHMKDTQAEWSHVQSQPVPSVSTPQPLPQEVQSDDPLTVDPPVPDQVNSPPVLNLHKD